MDIKLTTTFGGNPGKNHARVNVRQMVGGKQYGETYDLREGDVLNIDVQETPKPCNGVIPLPPGVLFDVDMSKYSCGVPSCTVCGLRPKPPVKPTPSPSMSDLYDMFNTAAPPILKPPVITPKDFCFYGHDYRPVSEVRIYCTLCGNSRYLGKP